MKIAAADQRDQHDRARHIALGVVRLLGQRADGVESEERVRRDRGTGRQRRETAAAGERRGGHQRLRTADQVCDRQDHEQRQDEQLHGHQHEVGAVGHLQPDHVERGREHDVGHDPDEERHVRELALQVGAADQPDDQRQEQVVQQDRPSHNESQPRIERLADVGVGRPGDREVLGHQAVTQRGEQHRHGGKQVRPSAAAVGQLGDDPEDAEDDDRRHVGEAEQHQRSQMQLLLQRAVMFVVCLACVVLAGGHDAPLGCHRVGSIRPW